MPEFHHSHPHRHARRGIHEHRHGHRGTPPSRWPVPAPADHWFAEHSHTHPNPADEASLLVLPAPGR
jgi:hypothetical protein